MTQQATNTMTVNTKTAAGRRDVHYDNLDALLADAERLAQSKVRLVGNWSLAKIFGHLARAIDFSIDGFPFKVNPVMRFMAKLLMKKKFLTKPLPSGFQIPDKNRKDLIPDDDETEKGLAELRAAIERQKSDSNRVMHAFLGNLTNEQWEQFHCRHAEMHMSFAVPEEG